MSAKPFTLPEYLRARRTARRHESVVQWAALGLALCCFVLAGMLVSPINGIRRDRQLVIDPGSIGGLPPDIALLGKLGTFRALAIDWAAIRAERLKQEGKTYEALELHKAVCRLAPRMARLWAFAAWNMAYNISVSQYTPEQRWQWVSNGIKLLRDEGIRYNPRSATLYKELAWIYWHKIGDVMDDEHRNYKRALAVEMEGVLGPPPVTLSDDEYLAWFRRIVDAPRDLGKFLREDAEAAVLAEQLRAAKLPPDQTLLEFVAKALRPEIQTYELLQDASVIGPEITRQLELLQDPDNEDARERLLAAIRSHVLRTKYKFDLDYMYNLMAERYGPIDWRNAFSHTLYWASRGVELSEGQAQADRNDAINTGRKILFALHSMVMNGRIVLWPNFEEPFLSYIEFSSDPRLIPYLFHEYLRLGEKFFSDRPDFREGTAGQPFKAGFITAMEDWIQVLYLAGGEKNLALAENFYAWLRENNPHPDGSTQERYTKTVQAFVMSDLLERLHTHRAATALVKTFIHQAIKQLGLGLKEEGIAALKHARLAHHYWERDAADIQRNERLKLPPLKYMFRDQIEEIVRDPQAAPIFKVRMWNALPLEQRQMTYDRIRPYFEQMCTAQQPPWNLEKALPEPPGMEQFRQAEPDPVFDFRDEDVDRGERYKP